MSTRLSPVETIMWRVGHDPVLRMGVGVLLLLDRPVGRAELQERVGAAVDATPRLSWRPDDPSRTRTKPAWELDAHLELDAHVRAVALPAPGHIHQLLELCATLATSPFDTARPPWDITAIEGLDSGKGAVFLRADHVLTDGLGGRALASLLLDPEPIPSPLATRTGRAPADAAGDAAAAVVSAGHHAGTVSVSLDLGKAARPFVAGLSAVLSLDPIDAVVRGVQRTLDGASSVSNQITVTDSPFAVLATGAHATSRFEVLSIPRAREIAIALGGSRNDLLAAATATGFGAYLASQGMNCPVLRLAAPSGRRRHDFMGGNSFSPMRLEVPTSGPPGPHFGVISERLSTTRREPAARFTDAVAATLSRLPGRLLVSAVHGQAGSVDFVATALPGLRHSRQLLGAQVEASYPFGPRLGCPLNFTAFGNDDRLDIGISFDPFAIEHPDLLVARVAGAFAELTTTAGAKP